MASWNRAHAKTGINSCSDRCDLLTGTLHGCMTANHWCQCWWSQRSRARSAAAAAANEMLSSSRRERVLALSIIICFALPVIAAAFTGEENNNEQRAHKQSFVLVQLLHTAAISLQDGCISQAAAQSPRVSFPPWIRLMFRKEAGVWASPERTGEL